jgi:hypothetical protein
MFLSCRKKFLLVSEQMEAQNVLENTPEYYLLCEQIECSDLYKRTKPGSFRERGAEGYVQSWSG